MRRFELIRDHDATGVSGTGKVAEGVELSTGDVCMGWTTATRSIVIYRSIGDVVKIHGHGGATRIVWLDDPDAEPLAVTGGPTPLVHHDPGDCETCDRARDVLGRRSFMERVDAALHEERS